MAAPLLALRPEVQKSHSIRHFCPGRKPSAGEWV